MTAELVPSVREAAEYQDGNRAFIEATTKQRNGDPSSLCPHEKGDAKTSWLCGWYDARTNDRLGHIFEQRGMKHP